MELQAFLDEADDRVESAVAVGTEGLAGGVPGRDVVQDGLRVGAVLQGPLGVLEALLSRLRSSEAVR